MRNYEFIDLTTTNNCTAQMIQQLVRQNRPAVIRYQAVQQLPDYLAILKQDFTAEKVSVLQRPLTHTNAAAHGKFISTTIQQYFQELTQPDSQTKHDWIVLSTLNQQSDLLQTLMPSFYYQAFPKKHELRLWITPRQGFTGAHFDSTETFNLQLYGNKKFLLYPKGISRYHARNPLTGFGHTSRFNDFEQVDVTQYPNWNINLKNKVEINLNPGEIIYIPPGWWHQVYNDQSLSINGLLNFYSTTKLLKKPYILLDLFLKILRKQIIPSNKQ